MQFSFQDIDLHHFGQLSACAAQYLLATKQSKHMLINFSEHFSKAWTQDWKCRLNPGLHPFGTSITHTDLGFHAHKYIKASSKQLAPESSGALTGSIVGYIHGHVPLIFNHISSFVSIPIIPVLQRMHGEIQERKWVIKKDQCFKRRPFMGRITTTDQFFSSPIVVSNTFN